MTRRLSRRAASATVRAVQPKLPRVSPVTLLIAAVAVMAAIPAWVVDHPPVMDWPFHLATIRVVADFGDPAFGFADHFTLTLWRTQYVLFYLLGAVLSAVVGVHAAMMTLVSGYLAGTVLGMAALLRALGRDPRVALLVAPVLPNVLFYYGLFPFLIGVPLVLFGLAVALRHFDAVTSGEMAGRRGWIRAVGLGVLALALFFTHAFPFLIFGLGFAALFPWRFPRRWLLAGGPVVPSLVAAVIWAVGTEAGQLSLGALTDGGSGQRLALDAALADIPHWLMDALASTRDDALFLAFLGLVFLASTLAQGAGPAVAAEGGPTPDGLVRPASPWRLRLHALLPLACAVLYFRSPQGNGYLWLIAQRFPMLFVITALPLLRFPGGRAGHVVTALAALLALLTTWSTVAAFRAFERDDVGDFDAAAAQLPPRAKVAALIFDKGSSTTNGRFAPFLHFGSYVQADHGGVVMFSYAGYAHWPFDFAPGKAPPGGSPARLRWEWTPERVSARDELAPYYTHVLVRGDRFRPADAPFQRVYDGARWDVWENTALKAAGAAP